MDIVKYLRQSASVSDDDDFIVMMGAGRCTEAADEIERLRDALRAIETISDCHENARQIARAALGEDK